MKGHALAFKRGDNSETVKIHEHLMTLKLFSRTQSILDYFFFK